MRKYKYYLIILAITFMIAAMYFLKSSDSEAELSVSLKNSTDAQSVSKIGIVKHPSSADFQRGILKELPSASSTDLWQVDLRGFDLTQLSLIGREKDLYYSDFDSKTKWPSIMPSEFSPTNIMDKGKNPGLSIKVLHKKGIDGKGIGIAIIDQELLVDHVEYRENLKMYEEINCTSNEAQMHGSAVASIAVGKNIGVAPGADLYYIADTPGRYKTDGFEYDFNWMAQAINRIVEVNKMLPKEKKIRVMSISLGWNKSQVGYDRVIKAVEEAKKQGIFVISSSLKDTYGFSFNGLGRNPVKEPDEFSSYEPGLWWQKSFYDNPNTLDASTLLVPMDSRTTASPTGTNDYVFYRQGGWSWSIPYIAGLYALACQVKPDITPEVFWNMALKSGTEISISNSNKEYKFGKIVNPVNLIEAISGDKK